MKLFNSFAASLVRAVRLGLAVAAIGGLSTFAFAATHVYFTAGSNPGELMGATVQNPVVYDNAGPSGARRLVGTIDAYNNLLDPATSAIIGYVVED